MLLVEILLSMWHWLWGFHMRFWRIFVLVIPLHTSSSTSPLSLPIFSLSCLLISPFHFMPVLLSISWNMSCPHTSFFYGYLTTHMQVLKARIHKWKRICRCLSLGHLTEMLISNSIHLAVNFTASFSLQLKSTVHTHCISLLCVMCYFSKLESCGANATSSSPCFLSQAIQALLTWEFCVIAVIATFNICTWVHTFLTVITI